MAPDELPPTDLKPITTPADLRRMVEELLENGKQKPLTALEQSSDVGNIDKLLQQRHTQRDALLAFCMRLTHYSIFLLACVLLTQAVGKSWDKPVAVFESGEIKILCTVVFGQSIGVILLIARSLWDEGLFLPLYGNRDKKKPDAKA